MVVCVLAQSHADGWDINVQRLDWCLSTHEHVVMSEQLRYSVVPRSQSTCEGGARPLLGSSWNEAGLRSTADRHTNGLPTANQTLVHILCILFLQVFPQAVTVSG